MVHWQIDPKIIGWTKIDQQKFNFAYFDPPRFQSRFEIEDISWLVELTVESPLKQKFIYCIAKKW